MPKILTIELISTFSCQRCQTARNFLKQVVEKFSAQQVLYKEVSVLEQIDYVVSLGVLNTPAIAINGKLIFRSIPTKKQLYTEIDKQLQGDMKCIK